nr:hypothetical protein BgiMline_029775 [Biomphalaria glabrata]
MCSEANVTNGIKTDKTVDSEDANDTVEGNKDESNDTDTSGTPGMDRQPIPMKHPKVKQQNSGEKKKRKKRKKKKSNSITIENEASQTSRDGSAPKEVLKSSAPKEVLKSSAPKEVLKSSAPKEVLKSSAPKEVLKSSAPKEVLKSSAPKEVLESSAPKEVLKSSVIKEKMNLQCQDKQFEKFEQRSEIKTDLNENCEIPFTTCEHNVEETDQINSFITDQMGTTIICHVETAESEISIERTASQIAALEEFSCLESRENDNILKHIHRDDLNDKQLLTNGKEVSDKQQSTNDNEINDKLQQSTKEYEAYFKLQQSTNGDEVNDKVQQSTNGDEVNDKVQQSTNGDEVNDKVQQSTNGDEVNDKVQQSTNGDEVNDKVQQSTNGDEVNDKVQQSTNGDEVNDKVQQSTNGDEVNDKVQQSTNGDEVNDKVQQSTNLDEVNDKVQQSTNGDEVNDKVQQSTNGDEVNDKVQQSTNGDEVNDKVQQSTNGDEVNDKVQQSTNGDEVNDKVQQSTNGDEVNDKVQQSTNGDEVNDKVQQSTNGDEVNNTLQQMMNADQLRHAIHRDKINVKVNVTSTSNYFDGHGNQEETTTLKNGVHSNAIQSPTTNIDERNGKQWKAAHNVEEKQKKGKPLNELAERWQIMHPHTLILDESRQRLTEMYLLRQVMDKEVPANTNMDREKMPNTCNSVTLIKGDKTVNDNSELHKCNDLIDTDDNVTCKCDQIQEEKSVSHNSNTTVVDNDLNADPVFGEKQNKDSDEAEEKSNVGSSLAEDSQRTTHMQVDSILISPTRASSQHTKVSAQ